MLAGEHSVYSTLEPRMQVSTDSGHVTLVNKHTMKQLMLYSGEQLIRNTNSEWTHFAET